MRKKGLTEQQRIEPVHEWPEGPLARLDDPKYLRLLELLDRAAGSIRKRLVWPGKDVIWTEAIDAAKERVTEKWNFERPKYFPDGKPEGQVVSLLKSIFKFVLYETSRANVAHSTAHQAAAYLRHKDSQRVENPLVILTARESIEKLSKHELKIAECLIENDGNKAKTARNLRISLYQLEAALEKMKRRLTATALST